MFVRQMCVCVCVCVCALVAVTVLSNTTIPEQCCGRKQVFVFLTGDWSMYGHSAEKRCFSGDVVWLWSRQIESK